MVVKKKVKVDGYKRCKNLVLGVVAIACFAANTIRRSWDKIYL